LPPRRDFAEPPLRQTPLPAALRWLLADITPAFSQRQADASRQRLASQPDFASRQPFVTPTEARLSGEALWRWREARYHAAAFGDFQSSSFRRRQRHLLSPAGFRQPMPPATDTRQRRRAISFAIAAAAAVSILSPASCRRRAANRAPSLPPAAVRRASVLLAAVFAYLFTIFMCSRTDDRNTDTGRLRQNRIDEYR